MKIFRRDLLARLRQKFLLDPVGYGRPVDRDTLNGEYNSGAWAHFHDFAELPRQSVIVGYVTQQFPNPAILDLGCGSGRLAQLFSPHSVRSYVGLDLSSAGIELARKLDLPNCDFLEGDFETWRPTHQFDVIVFSECIGYARDPGALTSAFARFLAPGGLVVISHFRFGHWRAVWRRVERQFLVSELATVTNKLGQTWDIKLLRPIP